MDKRPSIEKRYSSNQKYIDLLAKSAKNLMDKRLLLKEDYDRYLELTKKETEIWAELF